MTQICLSLSLSTQICSTNHGGLRSVQHLLPDDLQLRSARCLGASSQLRSARRRPTTAPARLRPMLDLAGEGEAEQEEFYESLDGILSSSCSSTSASDDDADRHRGCCRRHHLQHHHQPPPSPRPHASSEPASVEERRRLLLQRLGLGTDPPPPHPPPAPASCAVRVASNPGLVARRRTLLGSLLEKRDFRWLTR